MSLSTAITMVKMFSTKTMQCLFIVDGLEFYSFHQKEYVGIFGETLVFLDFV